MFDRDTLSAADLFLLAARLLLAFIFLHEGVTLALHFREAVTAMGKLGVPAPLLLGTIGLQLLAGTAIAIGWHARAGALALAMFCIATAFIFHTHLSIQNELLHFEKDLAIAGGMLALAVVGSGALSVNGWAAQPKARA